VELKSINQNCRVKTMIPLLLTLIAHVLADFIFQTNATITRKNKLQIAGFACHGITVFGTLVVLLHGYQLRQIFFYSLLITLVHLLLDLGKIVLITRLKSRMAELGVFLSDQLLHGVTLLLIWQCFDWQPNLIVTGFYEWLISPRLLAVFSAAPLVMAGSVEKILLIILTYLTVCWGGGILVDQFLNFLTFQNESLMRCDLMQRTGRCIGVIERGLILTLTLNNSLTAVAFVFAAKSIARFNELNDRDFAEYYLVGTLLSTALAVGGGLVAYFLLENW
jgi:hypothetical protein